VVLVAAGVYGARPSSFAELEQDVASGDVTAVRVTDGLSPRGRGYATVFLEWRDDLLGHTTTVIEARPLRAPAGASMEDVTAVVEPGVVDRLIASNPDLQVEEASGTQFTAEFLGWRTNGWVALTSFGLTLSTLLLLVRAPQPWRATRWAWFWLFCAFGPLGLLGYLLLGGPTSAVPPPRGRGRRLTGGWALLVLLGVALAAGGFGAG
jgi:hypothetical protein